MSSKRGLCETTDPVTRRSYLKLGGIGVAGASLLGRTASADSEYDRVVNIVEAGADDTGTEPIDDVFERYETDGTLIEFPDGEYLVDQLNLYGRRNFGMRAIGDDVTLVPNRQREFWIAGWNVRNLRFEGFTLDHTAEGIHPTVGFGAHTGLVVKNITKRGVHDGDNKGFGFAVLDEDGWGLIENLHAVEGSHKYRKEGPNMGGATGVFVDTNGQLTLRNCRIEGFGDNGLYASYSTGPVQVEGGQFKNSDVSQVRLGSAGSYVRNAVIGVDDPNEFTVNARGVRVCDGPFGGGRVTVDNCDIVMTKGQGFGGVVSAYNGGAFTLRNSRIRVDRGYAHAGSDGRCGRAVFADDPAGNNDDAEQCVIENSSITGDADDLEAVYFRNRSAAVVRKLCLHQPHGDRAGVQFSRGWNNLVEDSTIHVGGDAVRDDGADVTTSRLSYSGSCPAPSTVRTVSPTSHASADTDAGAGTDTDAESSFSLPDAPVAQGVSDRGYEFPAVGTSADNRVVRLYGNLLSERTRRFFREKLDTFGPKFLSSGRLTLSFHQITYDPYGEADTQGWKYMAELGNCIWDIEPDNFWQFVDYASRNPPNADDLDYQSTRNYLKDAGMRYYAWAPARMDDYYRYANARRLSNVESKRDEITRLPQLLWNGQNLNALSSGLEGYLDNRA